MVASGLMSPKPHGILAALVTAVITVTVAACGSSASSSSAPPSNSGGKYAAQMRGEIVAITQCAINRGLIPKTDLVGEAGARHWLLHGHIVANLSFATWWHAYQGVITISGKTLSAWQTQANAQRQVPVQVCGRSVRATPADS